jgi:hypothetical protein
MMRVLWAIMCLAALGCGEDFEAPRRPDLRKEPPDFAVAVEPRDLAVSELDLGSTPLDLPGVEADLSVTDLRFEHPDISLVVDLGNLDL